MKEKQTKTGGLSSTQRERVIMELVRGKECASRLQALLRGPSLGEGPDPAGLQQLALQIVRSFTETLSEMGPWAGWSAQIAAVDCSGSNSSGGNGKKGPPAVKEGRGCYKRRRTSDSWIEKSTTAEDGCQWRKYGQKEILNSIYPRCYFRCTHKYDRGCKAIKQVQMIEANPITYQTTYINRHTCNQQLTQHATSQMDTNLTCFESNNMLKQEVENDHRALSDEDLSCDEAKSTLHDPWPDIDVGLEPLGFKPECDIGSLHGLDEEVNQLGDIDYLSWYDID